MARARQAKRSTGREADFSGVSFDAKTGSYAARLWVDGKNVFLGWWPKPRQAAAAHDRAVLFFGVNRPLNFVSSRARGAAAPDALCREARSLQARRTGRTFLGVHFEARTGTFNAAVRAPDGKSHTFCGFEREEDAARVRDRVALHFFGADRELNFPDASPDPASPDELRRELRATRRSSVHSGVTFDRRTRRFSAFVTLADRPVHLGRWQTEMAAAIARDRFVLWLGLKRKLNFPSTSHSRGPASADELRREARKAELTRRAERGDRPSRFMGVAWDSRRRVWLARASTRDGDDYLGGYDDEDEAAVVRDRVDLYLYGDAAHLNFPDRRLAPVSPEEIRRKLRHEFKRTTSSRYEGVYRADVPSRPWHAQRVVDGKTVSLGYWRTARDAAIARDRAALYYDGDHADLNFPRQARRAGPADAAALLACAHREAKQRTTSRYRGVHWSRKRECWVAQYRRTHIGLFDDEERAAEAYDAEALRQQGDRARLNFHPETGEQIGGVELRTVLGRFRHQRRFPVA